MGEDFIQATQATLGCLRTPKKTKLTFCEIDEHRCKCMRMIEIDENQTGIRLGEMEGGGGLRGAKGKTTNPLKSMRIYEYRRDSDILCVNRTRINEIP